jgi:hypothetical protein
MAPDKFAGILYARARNLETLIAEAPVPAASAAVTVIVAMLDRLIEAVDVGLSDAANKKSQADK